jgi:2,4-dienoyl-CoA reductase (NADPH2)
MAAAVHPENEPFLDFLRGEITRLGVEVRLGQALDADAVAQLAPDAVVIATGGRVSAPKIPGDDQRHVVSGTWLRERLGGRLGRFVTPQRIRVASRLWMPLGRRIAIVGADLAAIELAEVLAERGRRVAVLESRDEIAPEVGPKRRAEQMLRLDRCGIPVNTGVEIERIERKGVRLRSARGASALVAADSVILAGSLEPDTSLFDALRGRVPELHAVGDCTGLGLIQKATAEAARVACAL